jgi:UDP-N-acetylglucosamine 1-carboxyvinyltransferase
MDKFLIKGPTRLKGKILGSGSKNAALPIIFSTLLSGKKHILKNVPNLQDMYSALLMMKHFGVVLDCEENPQGGQVWKLDCAPVNQSEAPYELVRKMRASFFCLGPLLARMGRARVSLPGGCAIGARPVDLHLMALEKLGAEIKQESGYVELVAPAKGLQGGKIVFPFVSVGATENVMMAATTAKGTTIIENAACEPEVQYLANALISMGAKITGVGTPTIKIEGVSELGALNYEIPADRIEVGTYLIAAQLTGGDIEVLNSPVGDLGALIEALEKSGAKITINGNSIRCEASETIKPVSIKTAPYPGFATDLQAQWMTLMTQAEGVSTIEEKIFENRFMHVPELTRMGAKIEIQSRVATVHGKRGALNAAPVMATDLRASASLVLAGLVTPGETTINRVYHLDRGYEAMELKLQSLGANVRRVKS